MICFQVCLAASFYLSRLEMSSIESMMEVGEFSFVFGTCVGENEVMLTRRVWCMGRCIYRICHER
jgi:hypothetical protein